MRTHFFRKMLTCDGSAGGDLVVFKAIVKTTLLCVMKDCVGNNAIFGTFQRTRIMKTLTIISFFLLINLLGHSQVMIPTEQEIKKVKPDSSLDISQIFDSNKTWSILARLNLRRKQFDQFPESNVITIGNDNDSFTSNGGANLTTLVIIDENHIKIDSSEPELGFKTFKVISIIGEYMILESKFYSRRYRNGKLVSKKRETERYLWKSS